MATLDQPARDLLAFVQRCIALRRQHPVFRRRSFLAGGPARGSLNDVDWFGPHGPMTGGDWNNGGLRVIGMHLSGDGLPDPDEKGRPIGDDSSLLLCNGAGDAVSFQLPAAPWAANYEAALFSGSPTRVAPPALAAPTGGQAVDLPARAPAAAESRPTGLRAARPGPTVTLTSPNQG